MIVSKEILMKKKQLFLTGQDGSYLAELLLRKNMKFMG